MRTKKIAYLTLVLSTVVSTSACLKTRAQLREDSSPSHSSSAEEGYRSVPVSPVQSVEQEGRYAMDEVKLEITRLEGRMQDLERAQKEQPNAEAPLAALKEANKKLEERVSKLESAQEELLETIKKTQSNPVPVDPKVLFDSAMDHYQEDAFKEAAEAFTAYLESPKPKKADEATFLRAESYFKLKEFKKAIVDYSKFPEHFKKSPHTPEALYKIGRSFEAMGMKEDAKGFYQELVEKYPKSSQAKKAKAKAKS